jgi:transcriptional regulator with XRE-family HTH domain
MGHTLQVPSQLSSHLRALRKAKGLSQAALGARLGLSQARVARIEGDPLSISVSQLLRVLAALGVGVTLEPLQAHRSQDVTLELTGVSAKGDFGTLLVKSTPKRAKAKPDW